MRLSSRNPVHRIREMLIIRDVDVISDAELLKRFSATRDEDAFTALVRRHTPLVLGTARRVLHNATDADDVLQAAFLTLARKAAYTTSLAFSPDGRILAVANNGSHRMRSGDKIVEYTEDRLVVRLLDSFTGIEFHRFSGHTGSVHRLAWSADGRRLMSGSQDASCLIWDVTPEIRAKLPAKAMDETATTKNLELLGTAKATEAYAAMAGLTGSPTTTVRALRTLLKPVATPDAEKVAALIRDLDSPQFAIRDKAAGQLLRLGEGVEGLLKKALAGKISTEVRDRIEKLLGDLKPTSEKVRQGRLLELLLRIGDREAKRLLTEISGGAEGAWLTREAKSALEGFCPGS